MGQNSLNNLPEAQTYEDTVKYLLWNQFPKVLDRAVKYFAVLPQTGIYRHVNPGVESFKSALLESTGRQLTISGIGSLIDYDKFGQILKRPTPQVAGTGCEGNSLCIEPNCFGFTEGVIENNNILQNLCWSLAMPCLKDHFYSDSQFERKLKQYFAMFFKQPAGVLEAYQRTRLLKESIKVVCTDTNFNYSGTGVATGLSLPFYIDPSDPTALPDLTSISAGVGGCNLMAFWNFIAPMIFSGQFNGQPENVKIYGLKGDYLVAKEQTASVQDTFQENSMLRALLNQGSSSGDLFGDFTHDPHFPTFKLDSSVFDIIPQERLEPSTLYGYFQTQNPDHLLAEYRGLLIVPDNWKFNLVEPPRDDFSSLLNDGLDFRNNTPGVFPLLSSSMFSNNTLGPDGVVTFANEIGKDRIVRPTFRGLERRDRSITEAIRSEVIMTYTRSTANDSASDQLPNVGQSFTPQQRADGFMLKSTMHIRTNVDGIARPVLLLFKNDTPRSARAIEVCTTETKAVSVTSTPKIVNCCGGGLAQITLTFDQDVSSVYSATNEAVYRTGARGASYYVDVNAVSSDGTQVVIESQDNSTPLPCCSGSPDDYGTRGELIKYTGATNEVSEVMKAEWDSANSELDIELFEAVKATSAGATGTLVLEKGDSIDVQTTADAEGTLLSLEVQSGETCDLSALTCNCLVNAVLTLD